MTNPHQSLLTQTPVHWHVSSGLTDYPDALEHMQHRAAKVAAGEAPEQVWLVEHPPLYTAGTSANESDLVIADQFPVYPAGRGGQYTYHGPGQRVAYVMQWIIDTLAVFNVTAERRCGRVGVWVEHDNGREEKIAAIGIRLRKWVSFHGISINVNPNLTHFNGIVPCGISEHGVASLESLGKQADMAALDAALKDSFSSIFGPTS